MQLQYLTDEGCPVCGAIIVGETRDEPHTNGEWNETRKFKCGYHIKYSPNFRREETLRECPNHVKVIELAKKREKARNKLIFYINKLDVDDSFKKSLLSELEYFHYK